MISCYPLSIVWILGLIKLLRRTALKQAWLTTRWEILAYGVLAKSDRLKRKCIYHWCGVTTIHLIDTYRVILIYATARQLLCLRSKVAVLCTNYSFL